MAASITDRFRAFLALAAGACSGAALAFAASASPAPAAPPGDSPVASEATAEQGGEGVLARPEPEEETAPAGAAGSEEAAATGPEPAQAVEDGAEGATGTAAEEGPSEEPEGDRTAGDEEAAGAEPEASAVEGAAAPRLVAVEVEESDAGVSIRLRTEGTLAGAEDFAIGDPPRLVIDLPGVVHEVTPDQIDVQLGGVERIRVGQHPDKARVVVDLAGEASRLGPEVVPVPQGLLVTLGDVVARGDDASAAAPPAERAEDGPEAAAPARMTGPSEETPGDPEPGGASSDAGTGETAAASGSADAAGPGTSEDAGAAPDGAAERSRVGQDEPALEEGELASPAPAEKAASTEKAASADEAASAEDGASAEPVAGEAPATAAGDAASPLRVYGVEFDSDGGRDRVAVAHDPGAGHRLYEPDAETVVLSIPGAEIDPDAAIRVVPEPGGPVSLVTAFQQPGVETPEVRVVVKRAPNAVPRVTQKRQALLLDFAAAGVAAATPPVYAGDDAVGEPAVPAEAPAAGGAAAVPALAGPETSQAAAAPASIGPRAGVDILEEGGLHEGKKYTGRRISLDFKDADIENLLRLIAEVSDLNIIAGEDVSGKVTIRLVDTPWDQALDLILLTKGLGFMRVGNVLRIAPLEVIQAEEEARLQERRAKEKLQDLVVKLQPVNYADVGDVQGMVQRLLTPRGTVNVDKRTNTVIIKDIPSVIDEATALIKAIDTQTPQVMIEAKIVEANLDFSRDLGTELGFGTQPDEDYEDFTVGGVKPITSTGEAGVSEFPYNAANNVVFTNPITSAATGVLNLGSFILDDRANVALRLSAAENNGEGKVISSPRVVTLDNSEAVIEQGVSIPFQTFENGDAQLEFVDAVLSLKVTPHITADRSIIMEIEVSRDAPDDSVSTPTGSPAIAKNQAKTEALIKDSQTLVLGGIYVVNKSDRQSRTPFLHKLPALGWLFRNSLIRDIRKELLIFVTPRVVQSPEIDADAA